jgi:probable phosphoglycerate mutase
MTAPDTRLVLIRHGESDAQDRGYVSGHDVCGGLSDRGRDQARRLRDRLLATHELGTVDVLYTSILARAIETAEIIAPAIGEIPPQRECDWCEIHPGEAEGLTWPEYREKYPWTGDLTNPFLRRAPGSETWAEFFVRAGGRLRRIADDHPGERVVVVCHGGIVGASFIALGELALRNGSAFTHETANTSLTEWRFTDDEWRLVRYNDAAHLLAPS